MDFCKHFHVIFNEYVQTYKGKMNTMKLQTVRSLALGPFRNLQGGICCYILDTGKVLHHFVHDVTIMKILTEVSNRLAYQVCTEKSVKGLIFGDQNNNIDQDASITGVVANGNDNLVNHSTIFSYSQKMLETEVMMPHILMTIATQVPTQVAQEFERMCLRITIQKQIRRWIVSSIQEWI